MGIYKQLFRRMVFLKRREKALSLPDTTDIKRCPFCGAQPKLSFDIESTAGNVYLVCRLKCNSCHTAASSGHKMFDQFNDPIKTWQEAKDKAISQWNKRIDTTMPQEKSDGR